MTTLAGQRWAGGKEASTYVGREAMMKQVEAGLIGHTMRRLTSSTHPDGMALRNHASSTDFCASLFRPPSP